MLAAPTWLAWLRLSPAKPDSRHSRRRSGLRLVHGVQPYLYMERLDAGVHLRIPDNSEAVFRAAVHRDGLAIADVLQIWLDVSNHPSRGKEQADHISHHGVTGSDALTVG